MLNSGEKEAEIHKVRDSQAQLRFILALPNRAERKISYFMQKAHYPFITKTLSPTKRRVEHTRDVKNKNLDDSQPEGKVRNLALIFLL